MSALLVVACGGDPPVSAGSESSSSSSGSSSTGVTTAESSSSASESSGWPSSSEGSTSSGTAGESSSESSSSSSSSSSSESSSSESSSDDANGTDPPASSDSTGGGCLPTGADGDSCYSDCDCASDSCFEFGILGGYCGECQVDADCPLGGCTQPDALATPPIGAVCNDGSLGGGCQSDAACQAPLACVEVYDVPGVVQTSTCSECATDDECGAQLCSPQLQVEHLAGAWVCVDAGSLPDGSSCDLTGSGDAACASGRCTLADIMGLLTVGVCGECDDDDDCSLGACTPAGLDLMAGLTPSVCE
jgi:hypothetical protein